LRDKLSSEVVDVTPEEIANCQVPNKFTILKILDKIYAVFRGYQLNGNFYFSSLLRESIMTVFFVDVVDLNDSKSAEMLYLVKTQHFVIFVKIKSI
jgi:hypothetical protein